MCQCKTCANRDKENKRSVDCKFGKMVCFNCADCSGMMVKCLGYKKEKADGRT